MAFVVMLECFFCVSWATKVAIGAQAGYSAQSTKVASGAERVNRKPRVPFNRLGKYK